MPHSDTGSTAGVTAAALALIGDAQVMAARPVSQGLLGTLEYNAHLRHAVPLLCDIAAAAVRLTMRRGAGDWHPFWSVVHPMSGVACRECGGHYPKSSDWREVVHTADCPAMQIMAAIRAAGEAAP